MAVGLAREAADDLAHAACQEQRGQAGVAVAGVFVHHGEFARALVDQAGDEFTRNAGGAKATNQDGGSVLPPVSGSAMEGEILSILEYSAK